MSLPRAGRGTLAICLLAGALALGLGACGRRGPLEAPPDASAPLQPSKVAPPGAKAKTPKTSRRTEPETSPASPGVRQAGVEDSVEDEAEEPEQEQTAVVVPTPTPRRRGRAYDVPKEPFILDPLL